MTRLRIVDTSLFTAVALAVTLTTMATDTAARQVRFETADRETYEPIMAVVSIKSQNVTFYDAKGWTHRAPVSTGTRGRETPAGIFAVVEKNREHRSNMYDDAKMPHMQRITWNGIAMHGGPLPGYAASHGCVRMPFNFAAKVFNKTRIGMRVIISPDDAAPIDFFHPALFSPQAEILAAAPERADTLKREATEAANWYKQARKNARATARQVVLQKRALRKQERRKKSADSKLKRANKTLSAADKAKTLAYDRLQKSAAKATEAATRLEAAESALEEKIVAAATAAAVLKDVSQAHNDAKKAEKSALNEVELQRKALRKLTELKQSADKELISADQALSAATNAKIQAEERKQSATAEIEKLLQQIKAAESDLEEKSVAADTAATAANEATQISDEAKKVEMNAARVVALRKDALSNLESRMQSADTKATELAKQIVVVKSDLKVRVTNAAAVAKIAHDATLVSDEANKVAKSAAHEVELQKEVLDKLRSLKQSADLELINADETLATANKTKVQAEEQQQNASNRTEQLLTQIEAAKADLQKKIANADAATKDLNNATQKLEQAKKDDKSAAREVALLKTDLRKQKKLKQRADAELKRSDTALSRADRAKTEAEERQQNASNHATEQASQLDAAKSDLQDKIAAAATAKEAVKDAKIRKATSKEAAYEAKLALEPVSVYISRATQKLYVRRNTHKPAIDGGGETFDFSIEVPISIRDPYMPIGTHIFTAMEHNELGLRWTAVTIDNSGDAREALDRITIPQDIIDRIAPTALPRSSIIISDEPLSRETNYRTEFVAVLSNHPQGGFITRKPTPVPDLAENEEESDESSGGETNFVRRSRSFLDL